MGEFLTNTFTNGTVADADEVMQNLSDAGWNVHMYDSTLGTLRGLIAHSALKYSIINTLGDIYQTTDGGDTVEAVKNTTLVTESCFIRVCKEDKTLGFAVQSATSPNASAITSTSGDTWSDTTADPSFTTAIHDVSFSTDDLIVIAGNDGGGNKHIVFGTVAAGQVTAWTDTTTNIGAAVYAVDMFDANTGYAVDSANNIWKTVDGGANWTNTTFNVSYTDVYATLHCISATTFIYADQGVVEVYVDTVSVTSRIVLTGNAGRPAGIIELTNGNVVVGFNSVTAADPQTVLLMTNNDGIKWFSRTISVSAAATDTTVSKCTLTEIGSNNIGVVTNNTNMLKVYGGTDNT